jgi:predicted Zn-dependent protease
MSDKFEFEIEFFESLLRRDTKNVEVIEILGELYTRSKRYSEGLKLDRKLVRLKPENPTAHYNLACSYALLERRAEAVQSLKDAIERGYNDFNWMMQDQDLNGLHNYTKFKQILEEYKIET